MLCFKKGSVFTIKIMPRGYQKYIYINERALNCVVKAQSFLPKNIQLVITRGYQNESLILKGLRKIGSGIFYLIYKQRRSEIKEIFGHNGHSLDGNHVDLDVEYNGHKINLLPYSVFTPHHIINTKKALHSEILNKVYSSLKNAGFSIHDNVTESLQIHCDLNV